MFNRSSGKLKIWRSYIKERCEQNNHLREEFSKLENLLKEGSIDEDTYERLKQLLETGYEQKRHEIRLKYRLA